jgi:hypothetical protein
LPSTWWCSSCSNSAGMFFFDLFCGGIVSCFSAETRWAPMLGVSENSEGIPEHRSAGTQNTRTFKSGTQFTKGETNNLQKTAHASKVVNPFTRALAPPFIGRRRDFYIPKMPSNLRNNPSVNMYMNISYIPWFAGLISYIYKPATSSHAKPRTFWSYVFDLASLRFLNPSPITPEFQGSGHTILQVPGSRASQVQDSRSSQFHGSRSS